MDFLFDYRNPLVSLLFFLIVVFIISITSYYLGIFKEKKGEKEVEEFLKKFDEKEEIDFGKILDSLKVKLDEIILIANSFEKVGDFKYAINLLLFALERFSKKDEQRIILEALGKVYFKAGFLKKAEEVFIEALKIDYKNVDILKLLVIIYEKEGEYKKGLDVIEAMEELGNRVEKEREYLEVLDKVSKKRVIDLSKLKSISAIRSAIENNLWKNRANIETKLILDLLWKDKNLLKNYKDDILAEDILAIKEGKEPKEVNLKKFFCLRKCNLVKELSFEYLCKECKVIFPLPFSRCPNCFSIDSIEPLVNIN